MNIKTSELNSPALDWAVAKIEGVVYHGPAWTKYSRDWAQAGPIIEGEGIELNQPRLHTRDKWCATCIKETSVYEAHGPTPLVAAMRCYVASVWGDEIHIPEGLQ